MLERPAVRRGRAPSWMALDAFRDRTGCTLDVLAPGVVAVAREPHRGNWLASSAEPLSGVLSARLATVLACFDHLGGRLAAEPWWAAVCLEDAWVPGPSDPLGQSALRPVLAFGRRAGDASTALIPDTHYLFSMGYLKMGLQLRLADRAWSRKTPSAIYCGGRHGVPSGTGPAGSSELPRERLQRLATGTRVPIEVKLGADIGLGQQLRHQMVIDVDGFARTWDAWAWKTRSRSAVLSQDSPWESFFSVQFQPWQDFVPLAHDLLDTEDKVAWCLANQSDLGQIARRGRARARVVYRWSAVKERTRATLEQVVFPAL